MTVFSFVILFSAFADTASKNEELRFLISGMRSERVKIRTAEVIVTGDHWTKSKVLGEFRIPVRFEIAFDLDSQLYRCDQRDYIQYNTSTMTPQEKATRWGRSDLPHGTTAEGVNWITKEYGGTVVRTPEFDLHLASGSHSIARLPPGTARRTTVREWDLAALGLIDWPSFCGEYHVEHILNSFENLSTSHSSNMDSSGLSRLSVHFDDTEYEIWIDEKQQYTPVSMVRRESLRVTSQSDVGWKEVNGIMVPISFRINDLFEPDMEEGYDLTLEWSHVNEPLDPKIFTPAGITDSPGAMVADMRLGQVVVERVDQVPLPAITPNMTSKPVNPNASSRWRWLILANVIGGGTAWWFFRRRAKSQAP